MTPIDKPLNIISDRHADLLRDAKTVVLGPRGVLFLMKDRRTSAIDSTIVCPVILSFVADDLPRFRVDHAVAGKRAAYIKAPGYVRVIACFEPEPDAYQYMASISPSCTYRFACLAKPHESLIVPWIEQ